MLLNTVARGETIGHNVLSVSGDSLKLAFLGPSGYTVTVVDARSLDEVTLRRIHRRIYPLLSKTC